MYLNLGGLPAHPLLVHATVVMVPLAALLVPGAILWPWLRRKAAYLPLAAALVALALVPATTYTGGQLEARLPHSALIEKHVRLADGLLPWVLGLAIAAALGAWLYHGEQQRAVPSSAPVEPVDAFQSPAGATAVLTRDRVAHRTERGRKSPALQIAAAVLAVLTATGTIVQVIRIGDSGARATWSHVPSTPTSRGQA